MVNEPWRTLIILTVNLHTLPWQLTKPLTCVLSQQINMFIIQARDRGIIDEAGGYFLNTKTQERIALSDAVDVGYVMAEFDKDTTSESGSATPQCETKSFAISGVVDQVNNAAVSFWHCS